MPTSIVCIVMDIFCNDLRLHAKKYDFIHEGANTRKLHQDGKALTVIARSPVIDDNFNRFVLATV